MTTVDIVMRTKDRPVFVRRALADILAQTFADWTLIIVNDGGDLAELEAVVAEFPDLGERVRYVDLPASSGRGASVMPGVDAGDSPLVNWHDDDDTWHPEFLARTVEHLQNTLKCGRTQAMSRAAERFPTLVAKFNDEGREIARRAAEDLAKSRTRPGAAVATMS